LAGAFLFLGQFPPRFCISLEFLAAHLTYRIPIMTNKKLNAVHVCESSEKKRACPRRQAKARPRDASGIAIKNKKIDGVEVWKQTADLLIPQLPLDLVERAVYYHLLRHSRLEGKPRLRFSIYWLARSARMSGWVARRAVRSLAAKGALRLVERATAGHLVEVRLPEEIPSIRAGQMAAGRDSRTVRGHSSEEADFLQTRERREAIHSRESGRCFYCSRRLSPRLRCLDHVVPQVRLGGNSYRNLVSCCTECNSLKKDLRAEDFLRWLFRDGRLTSAELRARLRALKHLASGQLRPSVGL
jgi:5-methylcytosine-specific restriction endonuclease McrA